MIQGSNCGRNLGQFESCQKGSNPRELLARVSTLYEAPSRAELSGPNLGRPTVWGRWVLEMATREVVTAVTGP